ncbi:MAG: FAD-dependent monooxygenase [Burkholderiaceae bacterium]|nr:FAD-dependent monooxygenase [Burkholderiaceae bacterium]
MKQTLVVIAGGGPVGMTLAHDLAARGIRCLIAERNPTTTAHPKMDITNARTMELFRRAGLAQALRDVAVPEDHCFDVSWITRFTGSELHRFRYPSVTEARAHYRAHNDGSHPAEPPMRVSQVEIEPVLRRAIEGSPLVEVRFGLELESFEQDGEGVTVKLQDRASGAVETVRCSYLIGCDGGTSRVRSQLDIALSGQSRIMQRFMTHFRSDAGDLLKRWGNAWHYQSAYGTLIAQNDRDVWTLHTRVAPGVPVESVNPHELVAQFVGRPIDMEVLVANPWVPHLVVADAYRQGRVLLAGDAAHQYIPTGGYGMNTGVADAYDLGWKLAAVLHGWGGPALLDSYEAERRPVGLRNCDASRRHNEVRVAVGQLYEPGIHDDTPQGERIRAHASTRIAELGNAENECLGIEMGFRYLNSPILPPGPTQDEEFDPLRYVARTDPGVRLPNVFLGDGSPLHDHLGPWFTLLLFGRASPGAMVQAAATLNMPMKMVRVAEPQWAALYRTQALVVRPDQHIAWRGECPADHSDSVAILRRALGWLSPLASPSRP